MVLSGQFSIVTVPPATSAAAINGPALDRSGSISTMRPEISPGSMRQEVLLTLVTGTPRFASVSIVMFMCGIDGSDLPTCFKVSPFLNLAATSSSPDTNCEDSEASIDTSPPTTSPVP